jgi:hypothetical protein
MSFVKMEPCYSSLVPESGNSNGRNCCDEVVEDVTCVLLRKWSLIIGSHMKNESAVR